MSITLKAVTSCLGYEQITDLSAPVNLTVPSTDLTTGLNQKPTIAFIVVETADVRWRDDGVAPTADVGMVLLVGVPFQYDGDLTRIQFTDKTAGAILNISYYA